MTLRDLATMARARRVEEWDRTTALMSWIARKWTGEDIDPDRLNPYRAGERKIDPARLTPGQRRAMADRQIDHLEDMLTGRPARRPRPTRRKDSWQ